MRKFEKVEYTNPIELLFLFVSTIAVFFGVIFALNRMMNFGLVKVILAITIALLYFIFLKKKYIVKISDFELSSNKLEWNNKSVDFKNLDHYKIHWLIGAGLKFKFKNGKTIRISSNEFFCNSQKFVNLCEIVDSKLLSYNNGNVVRRKSFFETKQGYYYVIVITILFVVATIYKLFTGEKYNYLSFILTLVLFGIVWSGVKWKRK